MCWKCFCLYSFSFICAAADIFIQIHACKPYSIFGGACNIHYFFFRDLKCSTNFQNPFCFSFSVYSINIFSIGFFFILLNCSSIFLSSYSSSCRMWLGNLISFSLLFCVCCSDFVCFTCYFRC